MKPFDLEKALAGEPVKLRGGDKAYIKFDLSKERVTSYKKVFQITGYVINQNDGDIYIESWLENGNYYENGEISNNDIVGMWEEPTPTVTLKLPCPPENVEDRKFGIFISDVYGLRLTKDIYFAKREDIEEWIRALSNLLTIKKEQEIKELENAPTN